MFHKVAGQQKKPTKHQERMLCSCIPCGKNIWFFTGHGLNITVASVWFGSHFALLSFCHRCNGTVQVGMHLFSERCFLNCQLEQQKKEKPVLFLLGLSDRAISLTLSSRGEYEFTHSHLGFCLDVPSVNLMHTACHPRTHTRTQSWTVPHSQFVRSTKLKSLVCKI